MIYRVKLENYQGPIELLLYLIRRDELDICAIPIARITSEFLGYVKSLVEFDLDDAAEFISVVTMLLRLKIRSLLPRSREEEAEPPGTASLADILEELARYRKAAAVLSTIEERRRRLFPRSSELVAESAEDETGNLFELALAFQMILQRSFKDEGWELSLPEIRLEEQMAMLRERLAGEKKVFFSTVLRDCRNVQQMVVVFIAVLELVRLGEVSLRQESMFRDIVVRRTAKVGFDPKPGATKHIEHVNRKRH